MIAFAVTWAYAQSWATPVLAFVLAQTSGTTVPAAGGGSSSIPWSQIFGSVVTPVIVLGLLMAGALRVGSAVDKEWAKREELWTERLKAETTRADKAETALATSEAARDKLRDIAEDKFLPLLRDTTHTLERVYDFFIDRKTA